MENITIIAIAIATLLMLSEVVLPGGIAFSAGFSLLVVSMTYELKIVEGFMSLGLMWVVLTLIITMIVAYFLSKTMSGGTIKDVVDENDGMIGSQATVTEAIDQHNGRVMFRGTTWKAVSRNNSFKAGDKVTIVAQDDLVLVVEEDEESTYLNLNKEN